MPMAYRAFIALTVLVAGCSSEDPAETVGSSSSAGAGGGGSTSVVSTTSTSSTASTGGGGGQEPCANCLCDAGETKPCYSGDPVTEGVGVCIGGVSTCEPDGLSWGPCVGEVLPSDESCATLDDDDCDGALLEDEGCCVPNVPLSCYTGPAGTEGVGLCTAGSMSCGTNGLPEGACSGEVLPVAPSCAMPLVDDDCDGDANEGCCAVGTWSFTAVDADVGNGTSLALDVDAQGTVRIGYGRYKINTSGNESHAKSALLPRGGSWTLSTVSTGSVAVTSAFAFAADGLHAIYSAFTTAYYARPDGVGGWITETAGGGGGSLALALAGDGTVHYFRMTANFSSIGPQSYTLSGSERSTSGMWMSSGSIDNYVLSIKMRAVSDGVGRVHLLYGDKLFAQSNFSSFNHRIRDAMGVWSATTSVGSGMNDIFDIAGADDGTAHIGFADVLGDYEHQVHGTTVTNVGCTTCPEPSTAPVLAVDHDGHPHTLYDGVLFEHDGSVWSMASVPASLGDIYALHVDDAGGVHVAWFEGSTLMYGYRCP